MHTFLDYAVGTVVRPRRTYRALLRDPQAVRIGGEGLLTLSLAYFGSISLGLARDPSYRPKERVVLRIPVERYYAAERLFVLPVAIGETILTAGIVRLLARCWGGQGRFEELFALLGLSHVTLVLSMAIPDTVALFRPAWRGAPPYVVGGSVWMFALLVLAIREAEHLSWPRSAAIAVPAAAANGMVVYVFLR